MSTLKDDLKAALSASLDVGVKPDVEAFYDTLGDLIRKYSSNVKITVGDTAPSSPEPNEIWINTNP